MAKWLSEMSKRGMGLGPAEFLDFVQGVVKKEKRKTDFINDRPSYTWYYSFMARNSHLIEKRQESSLENSRAKVTSQQLDKWFASYYKFLSELHLLDKPHRVYNADESGFSMGSKASVVIGPTKKEYPDNLPHLCGQTKKRLTGMFCANAEGEVIPPFLVYPQPKPSAYDPLIGSRKGTAVEYTEKGWMNGKTFLKFLQHFDQYASQERPVLLLIDSVSSHIDLNIFTFAKEKQIELYRLIPNATHFLQPVDNGVFGPLKKVWYKIVRKYTKENPGKSIGKENFAGKLHEAFMLFYKPLTVSSSFRSTGIHPVDRSKISENKLKPALTFQIESESSAPLNSMEENCQQSVSSSNNDISNSPVLDSSVEDNPVNSQSNNSLSGLSLLADVALTDCNNNVNKITSVNSNSSCSKYGSPSVNIESTSSISTASSFIPSTDCGDNVSVHLKEALVFPSCSKDVIQKKRKSMSDSIPDCLTSSESIRSAALKKLESVRKFAKKEKLARTKYIKEKAKQTLKEQKLQKKKMQSQ
ncbi:jerky protein homolog-like [Mercenaria mercenaria]|uniref:jerky protein homolog-like n=1 Tax=Mercenaria mercenaria TaxID=6596 RepID=UPI00234F23D1|nr:jerky protein homolog-like [Mercenaria mercenaria]XP_053386004.1 jerky protein homolog-like [Mercenaria mercenaria]